MAIGGRPRQSTLTIPPGDEVEMTTSRKVLASCSFFGIIAVVASLLATTAAAAGPASSARGRAYGVKSASVAEQPNAQAQVPPGTSDHDERDAVAADLSPQVVAGAFHVEGDASTTSSIAATMQSTIDGATSASLPTSWNARGYATSTGVSIASAGSGLPTESANNAYAEAVSACVGGNLVHGSAAYVDGLALVTPPALPELPGTPIPLPGVSTTQPNQVLLDAGGIKLTFWETNWNPATLGTTNGSATVFTNALHLVTPLGETIISHAESTAQCAGDQGPDPDPTPTPENPQCSDGVDNDGDGQIDSADPGCSSPNDDSEGGGGETPRCQDGVDNDGDGQTDMDDPDCSSPDDDSEGAGEVPRCQDGIDNDGDGQSDMDDPDCSSPDDDSEAGTLAGGGLPRICRKPNAIVGTRGRDRLKGTKGKDIICGLAGKDVLRGRGGRDKILGHKGNDRMFGQKGNDRIRGHGGRDRASGGRGRDRLYGNKGNDKLKSNAGNDRLFGHGGRDALVGGGGRDRLRGGPGKDRLRSGAGNDGLNGQAGRDRCRPGSGRNRMKSCEVTRKK
jgi:hypothetical protein